MCYREDVNRYRLLTAEEEKIADANTLVTANLRLVIRIAKRHRHRGLDLEDLIAEGNLALMRAAQHFKPERGKRFASYAGVAIRQGIERALRDKAPIIHIPDSVYQFMSDTQRTPQQQKLLDQAQRSTCVGVHEMDVPDIQVCPVDADDEWRHLLGLMNHLNDREKLVLNLRYGLQDQEPMTLEEVGARLAVTKERVRQIHAKATSKLRGMYHAAQQVYRGPQNLPPP